MESSRQMTIRDAHDGATWIQLVEAPSRRGGLMGCNCHEVAWWVFFGVMPLAFVAAYYMTRNSPGD